MITKNSDPNQLLTESQASQLTGISVKSLQKKRMDGSGFPFVRVSSRCIRYRYADIVNWIEDRTVESTKQTIQNELCDQ